MKIGMSLPQIGTQASAENLIKVAQRAEALGYDSVWVLERLLWPLHPQEPYPATPDGTLPEAYQTVFDPIETLAFLAAHTSKVQLGTSVLVLPYHTPIQLARRLATLDVLSAGRAAVGVGVGWSHDEFDAVGTPFARRGARSDEFLAAMLALWGEDPVEFKGDFYRIPASKVGPKPVQKPRPPIYIAGFGAYAFERAVRYGDGWNPSGSINFDWLAGMIRQFQDMAHQAGRGDLDVVLRAFDVVTEAAPGGDRPAMVGTLEQIKDDIKRLGDIGVTHLIHSPAEIGFSATATLDDMLALTERLMEISK